MQITIPDEDSKKEQTKTQSDNNKFGDRPS